MVKRLTWELMLYYWSHIEKVQNGDVTVKYKDDTCNITEYEDEIIVSFDGSSTLREWIGNLSAFFLKSGFHKNFYNTSRGFLFLVGKELTKSKHITVIGTSRGAAIAIIVGYLLKILGYNVKVISFVQPKVASKKALVRLLNIKLEVHRVVIARDFVDNLPPFFEHYQTYLYKLDGVKGKVNHLALRQALECKINE